LEQTSHFVGRAVGWKNDAEAVVRETISKFEEEKARNDRALTLAHPYCFAAFWHRRRLMKQCKLPFGLIREKSRPESTPD
jgi:hypothetical protein